MKTKSELEKEISDVVRKCMEEKSANTLMKRIRVLLGNAKLVRCWRCANCGEATDTKYDDASCNSSGWWHDKYYRNVTPSKHDWYPCTCSYCGNGYRECAFCERKEPADKP